MQKKYLSIIVCLLIGFWAMESKAQINPSSVEQMRESYNQKMKLGKESIFRNYPSRNIGPTVMSGRIVDIEVDAKDSKVFYIAFASGGVFKTVNNGISFEPIFDNQSRLTIGDIAIHEANPNILWAGTGENNSSRSSYAGFGMYKSEDAGKTWQHTGLENTQHIGRIALHPTDVNTVWVASMGALYSQNKERGLYKTSDGGKTWKQTLFINENTGIIDLIVNPSNPNQLWAAAWERSRKAWEFQENGSGSGLYYSEDGGENWTKITAGLPASEFTGRIGLSICKSKPSTVYLIVDNQEEVKTEKKADASVKFTFKDFETMGKEAFLALNEEDLNAFLKKNRFPKKYTAELVKKEVREGRYEPKALSNYFADANNNLFETEVKGAEVYRSDDYGKNWKKVNEYKLDGIFYTYGYYFGQIRVSPSNAEQIYVFGVPMIRSDDGGKTYKAITSYNDWGRDVHSDHHAMWINPADDNHILLGNDGGLYMSYDKGEHFLHLNNQAVGQFYSVAVDMAKPYNVYGGLQDNGTYFGSSTSIPNQSKDWEFIGGGDGMFVQVDPRNNQTIYSGYQFGNYFRNQKDLDKFDYITPRHDLGEPPLRFNWRTPLLISKHNADILYIAAQRLYRSFDKGDTWQAISPDLTKNKAQGNVPYSTISSFAESPMKFNLLYVGTDDGNVQVSKDGGANWELSNAGLPENRWVSSIFASSHQEGTVFVALNGYRSDETKTYIFKSTDFGKSWTSIQGNMPDESVNVIIQDPINPELLYVGTEYSTYISMDGGLSWALFNTVPNVSVYDMIIHPRENDLILATHGRSMYVVDVKPLQKASLKKTQAVVAFQPENIRYSENWGKQEIQYLPANEPSVNLMYYIGATTGKNVEINITDSKGNLIRKLIGEKEKGFYILKWDLKNDKKEYVKKEEYKITFMNDKVTDTVVLKVE